MIHSTSLVRCCLILSLLAAGCTGHHKTQSGFETGGAFSGGPDASSGGGSAESGGADTSSGGALGNGGDTSAGGATAASGGTSTDAGAHDGGMALADGAVALPPCRTNADCADVAGTPLCQAITGKCIACHTNLQCGPTEQCENTICTGLPKCQNSLDCASAPGGESICDQENGVCVQCTGDADCGDGKVCTNRVCHVSCSSDNDCTAQHMLCNQGIGFYGQCTQCVADSDCKSGEYCESGACVPETCKPAQQSCNGDLVVQCNDTGSGVTPLTQCTLVLLSSCIVQGDNAQCVGACQNGKQDGFETDVDCGGPACPRCEPGKACTLPTDCSSNKCTSNVCTK